MLKRCFALALLALLLLAGAFAGGYRELQNTQINHQLALNLINVKNHQKGVDK